MSSTTSENTEKYKIYLAALLHDIGKFWQRADKYENGKWQDLDTNKFNETTFCPKYNNSYSHKHVLWTAQFIEEILSVLGDGDNSLIRMAAMHHNPGNNNLFNIITKADHLSSGMDRNQLTEDQRNENDVGSYKSTPIRSIFGVISREDNELKYRLPVQILDVKNIMPISEEFKPNEIENLYKQTWNEFVNEIKTLKNKYLTIYSKSFGDTLLYLLQKYCSYIPSSTHDFPDVSLYDHCKTTAAFAVCLYDYLKEKNKEVLGLEENECPFILLGADISGIQKYIFNVISKNAAKNLKGRSFYLHLITTTIAKKILDITNLFECNLVYNSGGGFYMILPNTKKVRDGINKIEKETQKALLEKNHGDLSIAIDYVEFSCKDILNKEVSEIWKKLFEKLELKKQQKFSSLLENNSTTYNLFFNTEKVDFSNENEKHWRTSINNMIEEGNTPQKDDITGKPVIEPKKLDELTLSKTTKEQIVLGKELKSADIWIISDTNNNADDVEFLGYYHYLIKENQLQNFQNLFDSEKTKVLYFNKTNFIPPNIQLLKNATFGFEFYGGNTYPIDNKEPKSYDQLPKGKLNKNAIIRMDVDNLGYLFQNGFKPHQRSFSRYSQLSRNLDLFFKGYLTYLWENNNDYKNHTVILYAGGDDLFLLGDWKITIDFAKRIRKDFKEYVCDHPLITLSAGIIIVPPKYPILKMAEWCEEMEQKGKSYEWKNEVVQYLDKNGNPFKTKKSKDAIGFMEFAINWDIEFKLIESLGNEIYDKIVNKSLPKTFVQKLIQYFELENYSKIINNTPNSHNQITHKRLYWLMAYDFSRMMEQYKKEKKFLEDLLHDIFENTLNRTTNKTNYHSLTIYALAARWAELKYRNNLKN